MVLRNLSIKTKNVPHYRDIPCILVGFIVLFITSCAAPVTQKVQVDDALVAIEIQKQREAALATRKEDQDHLTHVSIPLLKAAIPFCKDNIRPNFGFSFANKYSFPKEDQDAAVALYGVGEPLQIMQVYQQNRADNADLEIGDILIAIDGIPFPVGPKAAEETIQLLKQNVDIDKTVTITTIRKGVQRTATLTPTAICNYPVILDSYNNDINAYADGSRIVVLKGLLRFVHDDQELALVISHELAHNAMGHIDAKKQNAAIGSIFDILAAVYGVNTQGVFGKLASQSYSQEFEAEADSVGLYIMARAGLPIDNVAKYWRRIGAERLTNIQPNPRSSHPSTAERFIGIDKTVEIIHEKQKNGLPLIPDYKKQQVASGEQSINHNSSVTSNTIKANRDEALKWFKKSTKNLQQKEWAEAIRTSSAAITLDPNYADAYANRAWAYCEKGLYDKSLEDANKALALNPNNAAALNNRGLAYDKMKQQDKAIQDYRTACELGIEVSCRNFKRLVGYLPSEEVNFYQKQGIDFFSSGDYDNVIIITGKVIEIDPKNAEAYSTRCAAKANKGLLDEAKEDCRKSIESNPDFSMAYNNLGYVLELEGIKNEAIIYYEMSCGMGLKLGCDNQQRLSAAE